MVNNSTNINKSKESFNSDGQQFLQYQHTKESLNSDGPSLLTLSFVLLILDELLTITAKTFFWFVDNINKTKESLSNRDGQQFLQYQQNNRKFIKQR
jgi:hypothetical protein